MTFKPNPGQEILCLALRDALLPKLLSGELRLPAAMLAAQAGVPATAGKLAETAP